MKTFFSIFCLLLITQFSQAQATEKATPPKIITKLNIGDSYKSKTKSIKFLKVISDSRCPTGVSCVWAGEAKIEVAIYENDQFLNNMELTVGTKDINPDFPKEIMELDGKKVLGYNLSPYPSNDSKLNPENYSLELLIK